MATALQCIEEVVPVGNSPNHVVDDQSDADLRLAHALRLPTMEVVGMTLLKRLTLVIEDGAVRHVFYPVFPPDRSAREVVEWLRGATSRGPLS
jgi:peroxiredoxin